MFQILNGEKTSVQGAAVKRQNVTVPNSTSLLHILPQILSWMFTEEAALYSTYKFPEQKQRKCNILEGYWVPLY